MIHVTFVPAHLGKKLGRAAALGRTLDPTDERIWRDALLIELRAGDAGAQRRLIAQLVRIVDRREVDDETAVLIADVERRPLSPARARPA